MSDLVGAHAPQNAVLDVLLGATRNVVQSNVPARSNLEFGFGNLSDGALAASGVCVAVPVPVDLGVVYSKITYFVGATAASTPTHAFAAVYSGIAVPALLSQSADTLTGAIAASGAVTVALATPQLATATNAPGGFWYVSISQTATAASTAASVPIPTAVGYQWFATGPLGFALTHGSAVGGVAPATIATPAAKAVGPVVVLT